jgi:hypothetical protein
MSVPQSLPSAGLQWEGEEDKLALPVLPPIHPKDTPTIPKKPPKKQRKTPEWTETEDQLLRLVTQRYYPDWKRIGKYFPGKPKSVIRRRWDNNFDPERKQTMWTEEEDQTIKTLIAEKGQKWKEIAKSLPGRPPDMVKNRYYGHIKRFEDIKDRKDKEIASMRLPSWEEVCKKVIGLQFS